MKSRLTLGVLGILLLNNVWITLAHFCFKKTAMTKAGFQIHNPADAGAFITHMLSNGHLWLGLLAGLLIFLTWTTVLSKIDLSLAIPVVSLSYIFVALASVVFLHEYIAPLRWAGIALIFLGVVMVSLSSPKEEVGGR